MWRKKAAKKIRHNCNTRRGALIQKKCKRICENYPNLIFNDRSKFSKRASLNSIRISLSEYRNTSRCARQNEVRHKSNIRHI